MATGTQGAASEGRAVRIWLFVLVALVTAMVTIGGATRLTGSGLSITEWKPVTGAIPPLSEDAWASEFEKYRGSSQYRNLNRGMELAEFKTIYWWEWSHRQLGRTLGFAFLLPFLWFLAKGAISRRRAGALLGIAALGGLQAAVGWIMVASGLEPGMVAVAPLKLAIHLTLASIILAALVWMAVGLPSPGGGGSTPQAAGWGEAPTVRSATASGQGRAARTTAPSPHPVGFAADPPPPGEGERTAPAALILLALILVQIALGGLVAGSRAGLIYTDWPLMNGDLVPPASVLFAKVPWIENFIDNHALVQLNHRLVAYAILAFALWHALSLRHRAPGSRAARRAAWIAGLVVMQAMIGVATLMLQVPLWLGLLHQFMAMGVLGHAVAHAKRCLGEQAPPEPVPSSKLRPPTPDRDRR